jgi:hypothetical protein
MIRYALEFNRHSLTLLLVLATGVATLAGCTPRTIVKKNPGPTDTGVRYYRPKPYLMVKPAVNRNGEPIPGYFSLEPTMLPDFAEEYSIHVRSGLGTNKTSVTLQDGWNLTQLNVDVDAQADETLRAAAEVIKGIPTSDPGAGFGPQQRIEVRGTNVPLGLYESIIVDDGCQKRLQGFRYIGFLPFSGSGVAAASCLDPGAEDSSIYGLVFDKQANVMVFKLLYEISGNEAQRDVVPAAVPSGAKQDADALLENNSANSDQRP